jgi:NADH-quinone oxidoreductase subunit L
VLGGVFVTALYSFRLVFMTFHGPERFRHADEVHTSSKDKSVGHEETDQQPSAAGKETHSPITGAASDGTVAGASAHASAAHDAGHHGAVGGAHDDHGHDDHHGPIEPHESPAVVTGPLIALAIPSLLIGFLTVGPVLFGGYFGDAIRVLEPNDVVAELGKDFQSPTQMALHGFAAPTFWLAAAGVLCAWLFFLKNPKWADAWATTLAPIRNLLLNKYYFDWFNEKILSPFARGLGFTLWKAGDQVLIDGALVNGSAAAIGWFGSIVRRVQNGYLYAYAFWMVIGLAVMLGWFLVR